MPSKKRQGFVSHSYSRSYNPTNPSLSSEASSPTFEFEGHDPSKASDIVAEMLNLSPDDKERVFKVLNDTDEDPVLVVRLNQTWLANAGNNGLVDAYAVLDDIATYAMPQGSRRDEQAQYLCFHFREGHEINQCRAAVIGTHPQAFAPSPIMLAALTAANLVYPGNQEPMAFCAQINKLGIRRDDIQEFSFFYM